MKDRQPTKVLANGAIRYGIYREDGTLDHYEYMKREDAPTVEGTPLNKANLLSDATAQKLWPNADARPEDPTVNDAFSKLAQGTAKVGDIEITARTDRSDAWLPCDGRYISEDQYPELFETLRVSASAAPWNAASIPAGTNDSDVVSKLSAANGYWFLYKAKHLYCSKNLVNWTDITPSNLHQYDSGLWTADIVQCYEVHYWQGQYVCLAELGNASNYRSYVCLYTAQLQQDGWKIARICAKSDGTQGYRSLFCDGTQYYFNYTYYVYDTNKGYNLYYKRLYYVESLVEIASLASGADWSYVEPSYCIDFYDEPTGLFYGSSRGNLLPGDDVSAVYKTQTPRSSNTWEKVTIPTVSSSSGNLDCTDYAVSGNTMAVRYSAEIGTNVKLYRSGDGGETFEQIYAETTSGSDHTNNLGFVANILCAWDQTVIVLFDADSITMQTVTPDTNITDKYASLENTMAILSSDGASVVYQDFTHSKKKIPSITPDSRSYAYIKALEE